MLNSFFCYLSGLLRSSFKYLYEKLRINITNHVCFDKVRHTLIRKSNSAHPEVEVINESALFDADWYAQRYKVSRSKAAEHYFNVGGFKGYNPSQYFHSQFYLESNPDVADSGMNPLVHYIMHGEAEGRAPGENKVSVMFSNLWGGHSTSALKELELIINDVDQPAEQRYRAAWEAARWYSFQGNHGDALALAQRMVKLVPEHRLQKERVLLVAVSTYGLGRATEAVTLLNEYIAQHPQDSDPIFFLVNTVTGYERLDILNRVYKKQGFIPLQLRSLANMNETEKVQKENELAFSFSNLAALVPEEYDCHVSPDSGKVTIIIPAYNAADKIHVALDSLLNQTYRNIEVLVVDDASSDGTFEVIEKYAKADLRVKALQQNINAGAYAARNLGLKHATGEFITTHDTDDWSHPQKIESQLKALHDDHELVGVMTHWVRSLYDLTITQNWRPSSNVIHWSHSSFLFKREVLHVLGEWDQVRIGADTEFIWRVQRQFGKRSIKKILPQVPMAIALDDDGSLTRTKATHVRTVYYGLRHIYREICDWWHRHESDLRLINQEAERTFPVPRGMLHKAAEPQHFDAIVVSDFGKSNISELAFELTDELLTEGHRVAFFHWPFFGKYPSRLRDRYGELIVRKGVVPIVFGDIVSAPSVYISHADLMLHKLDAVPDFRGVGICQILAGQPILPKGEAIIKDVFGVGCRVAEGETTFK